MVLMHDIIRPYPKWSTALGVRCSIASSATLAYRSVRDICNMKNWLIWSFKIAVYRYLVEGFSELPVIAFHEPIIYRDCWVLQLRADISIIRNHS